MSQHTIVSQMSSTLQARENCAKTGNTEWFDRHTETLEHIARNYLPSGAGIDSGTAIDLDASKPDRIVLTFGYHHMNDGGMYDGWTDHTAVITPSLAFGFHIRITGRDRNQIKDYLADTFHQALSAEVEIALHKAS